MKYNIEVKDGKVMCDGREISAQTIVETLNHGQGHVTKLSLITNIVENADGKDISSELLYDVLTEKITA